MIAQSSPSESGQAGALNKHKDWPVYIDAPTFTSNSNGIRCIYYIAKELAREGLDINFLPRNSRGFRKSLPREFASIKICPIWNISGPATLICVESVPANIINHARSREIRIVWWYLAPHGLLENPKASAKAGDKIITFSSFVLPKGGHYYFQPPLDPPWSKALSTHRPNSAHMIPNIGLYCGKGRLRSIPENLRKQLHGLNIHVITRSSPSTRDELFTLMSSLDGLITFDELSQLTLEAATLGVPVFIANPLFPVESLECFQIPIYPLVTRESALFVKLISSRRKGELKAISKTSIFAQNAETVTRLKELVIDQSWPFGSDDNAYLDNIISFGHMLRSRRVLYPHYGGQSAGSALLALYIAFLTEKPIYYRQLCLLISIIDELGRIFFLVGGGPLFIYLLSKLKESKLFGIKSLVIRRFI
jgi:hypothetical protein